MLVGYMRVSKADGSQVLDLQHDALLAAGVEADHIYHDKASGSKDDRAGLTACLKALRKGDVLVIWKLDRLGRNLKHLIETVEDLSKRGVGFKVIHGAPIDTTTSQGKLMFTMFGALAEFERDVIRERTIAGLAAARARGRFGGRKPVFTPSKLRRAAAAMAGRDTHVTHLCEELDISRATLYNYVTPDGKFTARGEALLHR
jgi:DNA invertase Pin-like site-specific DNA recombinase